MLVLRERLSDYLKFLGAMPREVDSMPEAEGDFWPPQNYLAHTFEVAECGEAFKALAAECLSTIDVPKDRLYGARAETLSRFFRRSGVYLQIADGDPPTPDEVLERLMYEVNRKECTVTYLALIDNIELAAEEVPFGEFSLKYLDADALKNILDFRNRLVFYPHTLTNLPRFPDHYFLTVSERRTVGTSGLLRTLQEDWSSRIPRRPTRLPAAIERGLRTLVLYDWVPFWQHDDERKAKEKRIGWMGFDVPAIVTITDDLLDWLGALPPATKIAMRPILDNEGEEIGEAAERPISLLDEQETEKLAGTLVELHDALSSVENNAEAEFLRNGADFLLKGFLSERLEQLLWHIIAIESALGEQLPNESVTGVLRRRLGLILGETLASRKEIRNAFRDLYDFRCDVVHGRRFRKDVYRGHLAEARRLARAAVLWAIRGFSFLAKKGAMTPTLAPKRSDLLHLIDLTGEERLRLGAQMSWLPNSFPHVPGWTK